MAGCAEQVKRVTLELGGKSANIVFADADLERAAAAAPYGGVRQRRPGLLRPLADPGAAQRLRPVHGALRAGREGASWSVDPADDDSEMGPLISAAHRERVASFVPDGAPVAFRGSAPEGAGFWFPPTVLAPVAAGLAGGTRGDLRPGGRRDALRGRGGRRSAIANDTPVRPVRLDLDPRRRPGAAGWPGRSRPGTCRSTRTPRCATGRPSAASSSPASAASSGPDALDAFTEVKNVFIADRSHRPQSDWSTRYDRRTDHAADRLEGRVAVITGRGAAASAGAMRGASPPRGPRSWWPTSTTRPGRPWPTRSAGLFVACRRDRPGERRSACTRPRPSAYGGIDIASTTPASPRPTTTRSSTPARRLAPGPGGQPDVGLPVLQGRDPAHAGAGQGVDHQHRVVRRRPGRGHLADLLHRVQGRRAGHVARARRAVRPAGRSGSTRCAPGRSTRRCSRSCSPRTPSGPPGGWCTSRWAASPSPRRSPPRLPSWPATTRRSSRRRPSSSTAASPAPT